MSTTSNGTEPSPGSATGGGGSAAAAPGTPGAPPPSSVAGTGDGGTACVDPALAFDGADDRATAPDDRALDLADDFTVEAWIRPDASSVGAGELHLVSHHDPQAGGWELRLKDGHVEAVIWGEESFDSKGYVAGAAGGAYVVAGKWAFVAATLEGDTLRVYYDGQLKDQIDLGFFFSRGSYQGPLTFGRAAYVDDYHYAGALDDVRLSKSARYVDATMPVPKAPLAKDGDTVALYAFDEASGDALADGSGNGHDGALAAAPATPARIGAPCASDR